jgi:hypothetical protein
MRVAYFDCFAGAAGDMIVGALLDAGADFDRLRRAVDDLGLPGVSIERAKEKRGEFEGTRFKVNRPPREPARHLPEIREILSEAPLSPRVREGSLAVFDRLAKAESRVHGVSPAEIHFHEVGASDAIVDIVCASLALEDLGIGEVRASALPLGSGIARAEHGPIPVPAPGTLEALEGVAVRLGEGEGETVTPTGAALLATFARSFGEPFAMRPSSVGYGVGSRVRKDVPNLLRVVVGEGAAGGETLLVLETNLDDVPGQVVGHALERLLEAGAVEAFVTPVGMKKNRPGVVLTALVPPERRAEVEAVFFAETRTLGVRTYPVSRTRLPREEVRLRTRYGPVRYKAVTGLDGRRELRVEYEEARALSEREAIPILEAFRRLEAEADRTPTRGEEEGSSPRRGGRERTARLRAKRRPV